MHDGDGRHSQQPQRDGMFAASEAYDRFMGRWSRRLAPRFVDFVSVPAGDRILDVGSGIGALSFALAVANPSAHVAGVDRSTAYVRYARDRSEHARVHFIVGDARAVPITQSSVEQTLSLLVMNFIPDSANALREMIRVTRPGGIVAAAVWDYGSGMEMLRLFWDAAAAVDAAAAARDEREMPLCRRGELSALWRGQALQQVEEDALTIELSYASFDDYWRPFLGGQGPAGAYTLSLGDAQRTALEANLRAQLLGTGADGPFTLRARAWAVKGVAG